MKKTDLPTDFSKGISSFDVFLKNRNNFSKASFNNSAEELLPNSLNSTQKKVLILEDDFQLSEILRKNFTAKGYYVDTLTSLRELQNMNMWTHAVLDLRLADGSLGIDAIPILKEHCPNIKILILTGYGSITTAVEAVRRGAIDYLLKPASFAQIEKALNEGPTSKAEEQTSDLKSPTLHDKENEYIDYVLLKNDGNISRAAKELGLHRQSLQRKLKKFY